MGGKSTVLRQTCVAVIMAQMGFTAEKKNELKARTLGSGKFLEKGDILEGSSRVVIGNVSLVSVLYKFGPCFSILFIDGAEMIRDNQLIWMDLRCRKSKGFNLFETNSSPLKIGRAPKGKYSSDHEFSGGGVAQMIAWWCKLVNSQEVNHHKTTDGCF